MTGHVVRIVKTGEGSGQTIGSSVADCQKKSRNPSSPDEQESSLSEEMRTVDHALHEHPYLSPSDRTPPVPSRDGEGQNGITPS
ncbi:MAG: hypothetical protein JSR31_07690 [Nitrospira sp.]|nr:hypothetical protein [Nitrospira sp.]